MTWKDALRDTIINTIEDHPLFSLVGSIITIGFLINFLVSNFF
jgi:hypothetical protein